MKQFFYFIFAIFFLLPLSAISQYKIEGTIIHYSGQKLTLLEYFGDSHNFADSTTTDENGRFAFELDATGQPGLYSIALGNRPVFNLIFNYENIVLKYDAGAYQLPEFIFSVENLIYYDYLVRSDRFAQKTGLLAEILQYYPEKDSFYRTTLEHYQELQDEFRNYTNRIIEEHPDMLVAHIIKSDRPVKVPEDLDWENYLAFNRAHYLDETDFTDTLLINTNVLTARAIDYLAFYSGKNISKEIQEQLFMQAVDTILFKAMDNGKVYDFLMQYMIEGFEMYGFEKVLSHIAENYEPANTCVNEDRKSELQKRVENLRRLAVGMQAPEIAIEDASGKKFSISQLESKHILILFWSGSCPHCNAMMPGLKKLYKDPSTDFEVIAISLDTSAADYNQALAEHALPWINYTDLKGWNSKPAIDYSIYATPSMFLLDSDRIILARPTSVYELKNALAGIK
ncbi:MAG: redoxin domain-containing protein [Bacteroidales bacterium]|nr:redoxin domain-containing protein [Bacteroidales bacterium]